jgi:uncharacterized protein
MNLEFMPDGPALVVEETQRLLVVADLHFGIEADLDAHGMHFASRSRERLERLLRVVDQANPDALVLLGDIKHSIPSLTRQEYNEMPGILDALRSRLPLIIFPGNHDIGIERFALDAELRPRDGELIDGIGYLHGHMYPSETLYGHLIVIGHHHPLLALHDSVGCALHSPAYLRAMLDMQAPGMKGAPESAASTRVLFMPAFNELAGYDLLQIRKNPFSPLSRCMKADSAEIILADGTLIGPLSLVEPDEDD